jgi:hypothetical protein
MLELRSPQHLPAWDRTALLAALQVGRFGLVHPPACWTSPHSKPAIR